MTDVKYAVNITACNNNGRARTTSVWEVVTYFKFHENRLRGIRAVGGSKIVLSHLLGQWLIQHGTTSVDTFSNTKKQR